jgi:hypothetical protein
MTITYCCYGMYADIGHSDGCPEARWKPTRFAEVPHGGTFKTHARATELVKDCSGYRTGLGALVTLDADLTVLFDKLAAA